MCLVTSVVSESCDPLDCSPPGSFVHGISQARILEWVAIPFSRGSSLPRGLLPLLLGRWILYHCTTWKAHKILTYANLSPILLFSLELSPGHQTGIWHFLLGISACWTDFSDLKQDSVFHLLSHGLFFQFSHLRKWHTTSHLDSSHSLLNALLLPIWIPLQFISPSTANGTSQ